MEDKVWYVSILLNYMHIKHIQIHKRTHKVQICYYSKVTARFPIKIRLHRLLRDQYKGESSLYKLILIEIEKKFIKVRRSIWTYQISKKKGIFFSQLYIWSKKNFKTFQFIYAKVQPSRFKMSPSWFLHDIFSQSNRNSNINNSSTKIFCAHNYSEPLPFN